MHQRHRDQLQRPVQVQGVRRLHRPSRSSRGALAPGATAGAAGASTIATTAAVLAAARRVLLRLRRRHRLRGLQVLVHQRPGLQLPRETRLQVQVVRLLSGAAVASDASAAIASTVAAQSASTVGAVASVASPARVPSGTAPRCASGATASAVDASVPSASGLAAAVTSAVATAAVAVASPAVAARRVFVGRRQRLCVRGMHGLVCKRRPVQLLRPAGVQVQRMRLLHRPALATRGALAPLATPGAAVAATVTGTASAVGTARRLQLWHRRRQRLRGLQVLVRQRPRSQLRRPMQVQGVRRLSGAAVAADAAATGLTAAPTALPAARTSDATDAAPAALPARTSNELAPASAAST